MSTIETTINILYNTYYTVRMTKHAYHQVREQVTEENAKGLFNANDPSNHSPNREAINSPKY